MLLLLLTPVFAPYTDCPLDRYKATCTTGHGFTLAPGESGYAQLDASVYTVNPKWKVPNYGGGWSTVLSAPLSQHYLNYCTSGNESQGGWVATIGGVPARPLVFEGTPIWCDDNKQCEHWPGTLCMEDTTSSGRPPVGVYTACQKPKLTAASNSSTTTSDIVHSEAMTQNAPSPSPPAAPPFPAGSCAWDYPGKPAPYSCGCSVQLADAVVEVEGEGIFATCPLTGICRGSWKGLVQVADDEALADARTLQGSTVPLSSGLGFKTSARGISLVKHNISSSGSTGCAIRTIFLEGEKVRFAVAPIDPIWCQDEGRHVAAMQGTVIARRSATNGALSFFEFQFDANHTKVTVAHVFDMDEHRSATVTAMELSDCGVPAPCDDPATCPVRLCFFVIGTTLVEMRRTAIDTKETIYEGIPHDLAIGAHLGLPLNRNAVDGYFDGFLGIALNTTSGSVCSVSLNYGMYRSLNSTHQVYTSSCSPDEVAFGSDTDWRQVGFVQGFDYDGASFYEWMSNEGIWVNNWYGRTWTPFPRDPETSTSFIPLRPDWVGTKRAVLLNFYAYFQ